jgi:hypothetical protein
MIVIMITVMVILQLFNNYFNIVSILFYDNFTLILRTFHTYYTLILQTFHTYFALIILINRCQRSYDYDRREKR